MKNPCTGEEDEGTYSDRKCRQCAFYIDRKEKCYAFKPLTRKPSDKACDEFSERY